MSVDGAVPTPSRWHVPGAERLLPLPPALLRVFGARITADDPRGDRLRRALFEGDPLADAAVEWLLQREAPERWRLFERALERGIDEAPGAPSALIELFSVLDRAPTWLDRGALAYGAEVMLRAGRRGTYALGGASLMSGYLSSGAVKPLAATGALTRNAKRRLVETSHFVVDIATSGELGRFTRGFATTVRVRMMHAMVRSRLSRDPSFRVADWGAPINQRDQVGTLLEFSIAYIGGLTALGYVLSRRERESLMHLWRYVGHLIGTDDALVPKTFAEGLELIHIFNETEAGPDEDSRRLAGALVTAWNEVALGEGGPPWTRALGTLEGRFLTGYARFVLGKKAADGLGLPDDRWKLAPLVVAPARAARELVGRLVPGARARAGRRGKQELERAHRISLDGRAAEFRVAR